MLFSVPLVIRQGFFPSQALVLFAYLFDDKPKIPVPNFLIFSAFLHQIHFHHM